MQILSLGISAVTNVQAEKQLPSIMTCSPESRIAANLSRYSPNGPPMSPAMRVIAWDGFTKATGSNNKATSMARNFIGELTWLQAPDHAQHRGSLRNTTGLQLRPEIGNGLLQAIFELNRRRPTKHLLGQGNVGLALLWVIDWKGFEN